MAIDLIITGRVKSLGRVSAVRGTLLGHTVSDTPAAPTWRDEFGNAVAIGPNDRVEVYTVTCSSNTSGEQVKLETLGGFQVVRLNVTSNRTAFLRFDGAPLLLPPGSNLFAVSDVWSPAQIPNLWAWWDLGPSGTRTVSGSEITAVNDLSSNGRHLGKAYNGGTTGTGPATTGTVGGNGAARFTTAGNVLAHNYSTVNDIDLSVVTVLLVADNVTSTNDTLVSTRDDAGGAWTIRSTFTTNIQSLLTTGTVRADETITAGAPFLLSSRFDQRESGGSLVAPGGSIVRSRLNGALSWTDDAETGTPGWAPSNQWVGVGGNPNNSGQINADIGEVLIIDADASDSDRQRAEGYLAHKWGLDGSLPAGHPWKSAPP